MPRWKQRSIRQEILEDTTYSDEDECRTNLSHEGIKEAVFSCIETQDTCQLRNLLDSGIHLDFYNKYDEGPLHLAVAQEPTSAGTDILDLLLYFGCPPSTQDRFGETALHKASTRSPVYVQRLLEAGAPVNARDNAGRTALMLACGSCNETSLMVVQFLLDRGAGVQYKDEDGQTALHYVCKQYASPLMPIKVEIMYKLLYAGLDVNVTDHAGFPASIYVYMGQHTCEVDGRLEVDNSKLLQIVTRGGANCLKGQLDTLRKHTSSGAREFLTFISLDFSMFKPVTSLETFKKLYKLVKQTTLPEEDKVSQFVDVLKNGLRKERTLKELSRIVIRERLNGKVLYGASKLGLPQTLQDFVTYSECLNV